MTTTITSITGDQLRAARIRSGYSQDELASMIGVSQAAIGQWERGDTKPRARRMTALAACLGDSFAQPAAIPGGAVDQIKAAGGRLGAAAALLSVIDILPVAERLATLETCAGLAADAARDLTAFVGGAV